MTLFFGEYHHTLDDKRRVALPVRFRASFEGGVILTRGLDRHLWIFPRSAWEILVAKLAALPLSQAEGRSLNRLLFAGAIEQELDSSGRVLVPEHLSQYASLSKDVVFAGIDTRIELWDAAAWQQEIQSAEKRTHELADHLASLGIL
jgi:MraZ protein